MSTGTIELAKDDRRGASSATMHVDALVAAWSGGERPEIEDILARHPELDDEAAIRLIYEWVCLRREEGIDIDPGEIARRFPRWGEELSELLVCQQWIESAPTRVVYPRPGEMLAGFRLLGELGRGAAGRVFLAAQPTLGDRPVVLKVLPRGRDEHLSLARLQHMNIMPLYSEHVIRDRNLQVLCMPSLGGASLERVIGALEDLPHAHRTGKDLLRALDRLQGRCAEASTSTGPFRRLLARAGYVESICAIGAALADGLQYAHERDLLHMDVKPSNVLLAGDGQPMLLDFHLARGPVDPEGPTPEWLGGTPGFMAPEHRRAVTAVREGRPIIDPVDGRADIHAMGMLLYVALGGEVPESSDARMVPLYRLNLRVSAGLSDIVERCLREDRRERYPDAASLASDLRRHLSDLPLRGVPNRSWPERWRKWRHRHPWARPRRGLAALVLLAAVAAPSAMLAIAYRQRGDAVASALSRARADAERARHAEASAALREGLAMIDGLPGFEHSRRVLTRALRVSTRARRLAGLHELAEAIRFRYGLSPPPPEEAPALIRLGREMWELRESLLDGPDGPETARRVRTDLRDLVILWADLRVRYAAPGERECASREAADLLGAVADLLGTSPSLDHDRRTYSQSTAPAEEPDGAGRVPTSAWEHYDLGRSYLRTGRPEMAAEQFHLGLKLRPQDFWLNFYDGLCAFRLDRFEAAVEAFRACIALAPQTAECFHNRALAYQALGQFDRAIDDYDRALALKPGLKDAFLNRGLLHRRNGRREAAIADLERAAATTVSPPRLAIIRENLERIPGGNGG